jgi:protein-S-isoprenylcysteine O-methyltransferase Ste14
MISLGLRLAGKAARLLLPSPPSLLLRLALPVIMVLGAYANIVGTARRTDAKKGAGGLVHAGRPAPLGDAHAYLEHHKMRVFNVAKHVPPLLFALSPRVLYRLTGPYSWLAWTPIRWAGVALVAAGYLAMNWCQRDMGASWRIGVRADDRTALVTTGVFAYSRNPIYLCALAIAAGLFLALPSAMTLCILVYSAFLHSLEVRLEEDHLFKAHGEAFRAYARRVPRWLPATGGRGMAVGERDRS